MKIQRIQITLEPAHYTGSPEDYKVFTVSVRTDCGQVFCSSQMFRESNFQDVFGLIMKDAERRIRDAVAGKTIT